MDGFDEVLLFEVSGKRFGLAGRFVRELVRAVAISPWPRSPKYVEGVINLRGTILPVLDLRSWLGLSAKPLELSDHFLVVEVDRRLLALRVDRALELARLEPAVVAKADFLVAGTEGDVKVAKFADGLVLLPDLAAFLAQGRIPPVSTEEEVLQS